MFVIDEGDKLSPTLSQQQYNVTNQAVSPTLPSIIDDSTKSMIETHFIIDYNS